MSMMRTNGPCEPEVRGPARSAGPLALFLITLVLSTAVRPTGAGGQDLLAGSRMGPEFHTDIIAFRGERSDQTVVEVYLSVGYDQLAFTRRGEVYRAEFEISLRLTGPEGTPVFEETSPNYSQTPDFEETLSEDISRIQIFTFMTQPGTYELEVVFSDRNRPGAERRERYRVEVPAFRRTALGISDLLLANLMVDAASDLPPGAVIDHAGSQFFARQGHAYLPNVAGVYANFAPSLLAYYEIYELHPLRQDPDDGYYRVEFAVNNARGETVLYYMRRHEKPGANSFNSVEMNIQDLPPGAYELQIIATDLGTGQSVTSRKPFKVMESYLTLAYQDYEKAVRQLRYIATSRELSILRSVEGERERIRLFKDFWLSRDPTPGTRRNEALIEYYRRIQYANEHFSVPTLEGWATDRGMVYITLGLPDYLEREDVGRTAKPRQLWVYNNMRLQLLFEDEMGFGDFMLQNRQEYLERVQIRGGR